MYQHLAIIAIFTGTAGFEACSSSDTSASGTLGSGGSTSTNGSSEFAFLQLLNPRRHDRKD
jgi:hypothetical protein